MLKRTAYRMILISCAVIFITVAQAEGASHMSADSEQAGATQQQTAGANQPEANPSDVASMDAILRAVYDVISGPAGQKRDWNRFRSLFIPGARLIPTLPKNPQNPQEGFTTRVLTAEDYIGRSGPFIESNGFFEREVARRTEQYGHIAHVFSTYESRHKADDKEPFARGINSFQLMYDGKRWWVVTILWDAETKDNPIPKQYLEKTR